jgi:C4-dicarboxylate-specific signal transduction histidine kinase
VLYPVFFWLPRYTALAAHQAQLYRALESSYNDLRQTQAAAMQHERLSALGQMATSVAHDINNAITPIAISQGGVPTHAGRVLSKSPQLRRLREVIARRCKS